MAKLQGESLKWVTVEVTQKDTQKIHSLKILYSLHKLYQLCNRISQGSYRCPPWMKDCVYC